jgi:hypothetical protein
MGYDMYIEKPDQAIGHTAAAMHAALEALDVARIAGSGVEEAQEAFYAACAKPRADYFRLNITAMGRWLDFMWELGMVTTVPRARRAMQAHKFWTNSGYLVSPTEIKSALRTYDATTRERIIEVIYADRDEPAFGLVATLKGIAGPIPQVRSPEFKDDDLVRWDEWIAYLRRSATMGGFRVC